MMMKIRKMVATTHEAKLVRPDGGRGLFGLVAMMGTPLSSAVACGGGGGGGGGCRCCRCCCCCCCGGGGG